MTTRNYATFDPANLGTDLALSNALATVTTTADGLDSGRIARSTQAQAIWPSYVEGLFWGTAALYNGSLDEWRITKGVARYDADFTPEGPFA